jgi:hypothetical protein
MNRSLTALSLGLAITAALLGLGRLAAPASSSAAGSAPHAGFLLLPPAAPAGQMALYGHIKTLGRGSGGRYLMRFDPAWFTSGITASRAKLADTGSADVPNDNYVIEESHRLLTYRVAKNARVTVLQNTNAGISATPITVSELARIVNGTSRRKLFEPLDSGIWIRVRIDTVREVDQQYQP